jgi:hypothetical protein
LASCNHLQPRLRKGISAKTEGKFGFTPIIIEIRSIGARQREFCKGGRRDTLRNVSSQKGAGRSNGLTHCAGNGITHKSTITTPVKTGSGARIVGKITVAVTLWERSDQKATHDDQSYDSTQTRPAVQSSATSNATVRVSRCLPSNTCSFG